MHVKTKTRRPYVPVTTSRPARPRRAAVLTAGQLTPQQILERAVKDGSIQRIDTLYSAAHILMQVANYLMEQTDDSLIASISSLLREARQAHNFAARAIDRYLDLWTDFARVSGMQAQRTDDFDTYVPIIARLLAIAPLVTDPTTGKPCSTTPPDGHTEEQDPRGAAAKPEEKSAGGLTTRLLDIDGIIASERQPYRRAKLTAEQLRALGPETALTVKTHTHISRLLDIYAKEQGITKRDLINEILVDYIDYHSATTSQQPQ